VARIWARLRGRPWQDDPELEGLPEDAAGYVAPRRRFVFPPSFLVLLAAGLAWIAWEPTADLPYELFGPGSSSTLDLGSPGNWHMDAAHDGARAKVQGFASNRRGRYGKWFSQWEIVPLTGLPVLVRRPPTPQPPEHAAEVYSGEGRLVRLDDSPSDWLERLVRPAARYTLVKNQFLAAGELPAGRTVWLLLEGDLPRADLSAIVDPLVLWAGVALCLRSLWRRWRPAPERARGK